MQRTQYSDRYLYADLDGLDDVHQVAKFTLRGAADAAQGLEDFAQRSGTVIVCGRAVGSVLENDILKVGQNGDIRFAVQVSSRSDWQLMSKSVVHGAQIAAHSGRDGGLHIDGIVLQDMSPLNLGDTQKSAGEETFMKSSGSFGVRHVMKIGGAEPTIRTSAHLLDLIKRFNKTSSTNGEHLARARDHMEKVGEHLSAAQKRYPFDNNVRSAAASHAAATESLEKIDLGEPSAAPETPPEIRQTQSTDVAARGPTFLGPNGRWSGEMASGKDPVAVTSDEPSRKMSRAEANDAFAKAFSPAGRARSRRHVTFQR